jgi:hypothetical protein
MQKRLTAGKINEPAARFFSVAQVRENVACQGV